jgi:membrane protease YdiL (CAAX protease family)
MNDETNSTYADTNGKTRFGRVFLALFALGLPGVVALIPTVIDQLDLLPPALVDMPAPVAVALALLNPIILLAIALAIGTLLAHRVGLRSLVAEKVRSGHAIWPELRPHIPMAFLAGVIFLIVVIGLDALVDPFAGTELAAETAIEINPIAQLLVGVFYGGVVEELLLRWGVMSLLVWIGWRLLQRGQGKPRPALVWTAIVLAALLFGIGHLPALAALVTLTPVVVIRTVLLNALGGLVFGWLFWRHSLEVAMVAHASFHVGLFILNLVLSLIA